jgi:hypothetical protein
MKVFLFIIITKYNFYFLGIHPVTDEYLLKDFLGNYMPKNEITPEHFQFYHQILNGVSGFIIYHFAYEMVDTNFLEDNNHDNNDGDDNESSGKRPCTSKSQGSPPKKSKH